MKCVYVTIFCAFTSTCLFGQSLSNLEKLIEQSNTYYLANKAAALRTRAATTQSDIIRNQFKPQLQAAYQLNYATYNNITGMVFPSPIPPIGGPPVTENTYVGVFGSAAGLLALCAIGLYGRDVLHL